MVVRPLVDVLRAVHCPERFDFGLRYLDEGLAREVAALMYPGSAAAIPALVERAGALMDEALAAWGARKATFGGSGTS